MITSAERTPRPTERNVYSSIRINTAALETEKAESRPHHAFIHSHKDVSKDAYCT